MSISYIIATVGRETLARTLDSIKWRPGDEILVVAEHCPDVVAHDPRCRFLRCKRGNDWGHTERNFAMPFARGTHIVHIDDDDWYEPDARDVVVDAIEAAPSVPHVFRMRYPSGQILWSDRELRLGNVGTPMVVMPNVSERFGRWGSFHGGDFAFLQSSKWAAADYAWHPEVIVELGK